MNLTTIVLTFPPPDLGRVVVALLAVVAACAALFSVVFACAMIGEMFKRLPQMIVFAPVILCGAFLWIFG